MDDLDTGPGPDPAPKARRSSRILLGVVAALFVAYGAALAAYTWPLSFGDQVLTVELAGCELGQLGSPNSCRVEWRGQPEEGRLVSAVVGRALPEHETVRVRTSTGRQEAVLDEWTTRAVDPALAALMTGVGVSFAAYAARGRVRPLMLAPALLGVGAYLAAMVASGLT